MSSAIVTTTINVPTVLEAYCRNLHHHGHADGGGTNGDVAVIVIGDRATPDGAATLARRLTAESGIPIEYWDVERQRDFLEAYPVLDRLLPYDSIQRRNLAYVLAASQGFDRIISIDDDNWPTDDDFLTEHSLVGTTVELATVSSSNGWFNSSSLLATDPIRPLYHRGFPTSKRGTEDTVVGGRASGRVVANCGLCKGVPDADAISHLDAPVTALGIRPRYELPLAVAPGTSTVFNTQNTAFHLDLLPCLYLPAMGGRIGKRIVGRYDDIWMSMFVKPICDHLGDLITVGRPLVTQHRNDHDLFHDARIELPAMELTNSLVSILDRLTLTAGDYATCYRQLLDHVRVQAAMAAPAHQLSTDQAAYMIELTEQMNRWVEEIEEMA